MITTATLLVPLKVIVIWIDTAGEPVTGMVKERPVLGPIA